MIENTARIRGLCLKNQVDVMAIYELFKLAMECHGQSLINEASIVEKSSMNWQFSIELVVNRVAYAA